MLRGVEQQRGNRPQQRAGLGSDDGAVGQLDGGSGQLGGCTKLAVRLEPRQHTAGVEVVVQLPAEFQIKLVTELPDALLDVL